MTPQACMKHEPAAPGGSGAAVQAEWFSGEPLLSILLDAVPVPFGVLNERKEFVFGNIALRDFAGQGLSRPGARPPIVGMSLSEAIGCAFAPEDPGPCPCEEHRACRYCGADLAESGSGRGKPGVRELRLSRRGGTAMEMRVWTMPFVLRGEGFVACAMMDVSHEKRRRALEQVFFHDVLNTVAVLYGTAALTDMVPASSLPEVGASLRRGAERLADEVRSQQFLLEAENRELAVRPTSFMVREFLEERAAFFRGLPSAREVVIKVSPGAEDAELTTDRAILGRALGNLVKNAVEASGPGEAVTLDCRVEGTVAEFSVHSPLVMPNEVQAQVFQRSYSTKGAGRGLGTYGAKLLVEGYLGGSVWFTSSEQGGTTFRLTCPALALEGEDREREPEHVPDSMQRFAGKVGEGAAGGFFSDDR